MKTLLIAVAVALFAGSAGARPISVSYPERKEKSRDQQAKAASTNDLSVWWTFFQTNSNWIALTNVAGKSNAEINAEVDAVTNGLSAARVGDWNGWRSYEKDQRKARRDAAQATMKALKKTVRNLLGLLGE